MVRDIYIDIDGEYPSGLIEAKRIGNTGCSRIYVRFYNAQHLDEVKLNLFVNGISEEVGKTMRWKIKNLNTGEYFDTNDFTTGQRSELIIEKMYAGSSHSDFRNLSSTGNEQDQELYKKYNKPQKFLVEAILQKSNIVFTTEIWVFSNIEIKGTNNWVGNTLEPVTSLTNYNFVAINVTDIYGLYKRECIVKIYNSENEIVLELPVEVKNAQILIELPSTFLSGVLNEKYRYSLFHTAYGEEIEFLKGNEWLIVNIYTKIASVLKDMFNSIKTEGILSEVVIKDEEFFTQRYQHCKYESITMSIPDGETIVLFDEQDLTKGSESRKSKIRLKVLDSVAKLALNYKVEGLITDHCKNNLEYQVDNDNLEHKEPHSNQIFDILNLDLDYSLDKTSINITPDYKYTTNNQIVTDFEKLDLLDLCRLFYWYNPFNIKNQINEHSFRIVSCRYNLEQKFSIIPDINWAVHLFFFSPDQEHSFGRDKSYLYYRNYKVNGLDSSYVESYKDFCLSENIGEKLLTSLGLNKAAVAGISSSTLSNNLLDFINFYIISIMESIKFGMHAYIKNGNEADLKPTIVIDYGAKFEFIRFIQILNITLLNIAIDILILWFTRGKNLPVILARMQKVVQYTKMALPSKLTSKEDNIEFIAPQIGMNFGGGYRYGKDGIAYNVIEYTLAAEPLFGVKYDYTKTAGDLLSSAIGIDTMFENARRVVSFVGKILRGTNYIKGFYGKKNTPTTMRESINREGESLAKNPLKYFTSKDINEGLHTLEGHIVQKFDDAIKDYIGLETEISLLIEGFYDVKINLAFNLDKQVIHVIDKGKESEEVREVNYGHRTGVKVIFKVSGKYQDTLKVSKLNEYIPDFIQTATGREFKDVDTNAELEGEIKGVMHYERTYKYSASDFLIKAALGTSILEYKAGTHPSSNPPVYVDRFICTGIIGTIYVDVKVEDNDKNTWEYQKSKKNANGKNVPKPFTIIPSYVYESEEKPVFPEKLSQ